MRFLRIIILVISVSFADVNASVDFHVNGLVDSVDASSVLHMLVSELFRVHGVIGRVFSVLSGSCVFVVLAPLATLVLL